MATKRAEALPRWRKVGEPIQFTRDELLAEARRLGVTLSARQFRTWAELGLLPAPERRIPPASTDKVVRALYPGWTLPLILNLEDQLTLGVKLAKLKDFAAEQMRNLHAQGAREHPEIQPPTPIIGTGSVTTRPITGSGTGTVRQRPRTPRALQRAAWAYVERFDTHLGMLGAVQEVELTLRLSTGQVIAIPILQPPTKKPGKRS